MQAFSAWTPPAGVLGRICAEARSRVEQLRSQRAELERHARRAPRAPSLEQALRRADVAVIAEIKRRSPSKGTLDASIDAAGRARQYEEAGAAALSVLTEPEHFGGSLDDLSRSSASVGIPILRKDFLVDPLQLLEARALGASAALLIARALAPGDLERMLAAGNDAGLESLVEVRDDAELERAVLAGARIIGVNTRNLETLEIDAAVGWRLVRQVPPGIVAVYESGIAGRGDVERAAAAGADAVLVGSALSAAGDPGATLRSLVGVPRVMRGD